MMENQRYQEDFNNQLGGIIYAPMIETWALCDTLQRVVSVYRSSADEKEQEMAANILREADNSLALSDDMEAIIEVQRNEILLGGKKRSGTLHEIGARIALMHMKPFYLRRLSWLYDVKCACGDRIFFLIAQGDLPIEEPKEVKI